MIKNLVQRYVTSRQKKGGDHYGVTEDDINELKQEISTFRSDLYEILRNYGMKTNPLGDSSTGNRIRISAAKNIFSPSINM